MIYLVAKCSFYVINSLSLAPTLVTVHSIVNLLLMPCPNPG